MAHRTVYSAAGGLGATVGGEGDAWLGVNATPERIEQAIRDYGIRYAYDTLGRVVRSVDPNGNRTLFYYDRENRPTHTVDMIGRAEDQSLAGEVGEALYDRFGQLRSSRRYAARLGHEDMDHLRADGGGGMAAKGPARKRVVEGKGE